MKINANNVRPTIQTVTESKQYENWVTKISLLHKLVLSNIVKTNKVDKKL